MGKHFIRMIAASAGLAALAAPAMAVAQDNYNRGVTILYMTGKSIYYVRYSNTSAGSYGPDRLGSRETIAPDATRDFDIDDGTGACRFDVKVTYEDDSEATIRDVNVCAVSHLDARHASIVIDN